MQADLRSCGSPPTSSGSTPSRGRARACSAPTSGCTSRARRRVREPRRTSHRPLGDRPRRGDAHRDRAGRARARPPRGRVGGRRCRAVATDLGIDLICRREDAGRCDGALLEAGRRGDRQAAEIVRVESGRPRFGREMTTETIPQEAGINERAVSFTKGCYIGQETVARLHYRGKPNRHLRGLRLAAPVADGRRSGSGPRARDDRHRRPLPPPTGRSRWRSSAARPSPAPRSRSATVEPSRAVVDLPFV